MDNNEFENFLIAQLEVEYTNYSSEQKQVIANNMLDDIDKKINKELKQSNFSKEVYSLLKTQIERDGLGNCLDSNGQISIQNIQKAEETIKQSPTYINYLKTHINDMSTKGIPEDKNTFEFSEELQKNMKILRDLSEEDFGKILNNLSEEDIEAIIESSYGIKSDNIEGAIKGEGTTGNEVIDDIIMQLPPEMRKSTEIVGTALAYYSVLAVKNNYDSNIIESVLENEKHIGIEILEIMKELNSSELMSQLKIDPESIEKTIGRLNKEKEQEKKKNNEQEEINLIGDLFARSSTQVSDEKGVSEEEGINLSDIEDELTKKANQMYKNNGFSEEAIQAGVFEYLKAIQRMEKGDDYTVHLEQYLKSKIEGLPYGGKEVMQILSTLPLLKDKVPDMLTSDNNRAALLEKLSEISKLPIESFAVIESRISEAFENAKDLSQGELAENIPEVEPVAGISNEGSMQENETQPNLENASNGKIDEEPDLSQETINNQDGPIIAFFRKHPRLANIVLPKSVKEAHNFPIGELSSGNGNRDVTMGDWLNQFALRGITSRIGAIGDRIQNAVSNVFSKKEGNSIENNPDSWKNDDKKQVRDMEITSNTTLNEFDSRYKVATIQNEQGTDNGKPIKDIDGQEKNTGNNDIIGDDEDERE